MAYPCVVCLWCAQTMVIALDGIAIKCMHAYREWFVAAKASSSNKCHKCDRTVNTEKQKQKRNTNMWKRREKTRSVCTYFCLQFFCAILHMTHNTPWWICGCDYVQKAEWSHIHACDNMPRPSEHIIVSAFHTRPKPPDVWLWMAIQRQRQQQQ